MREAQACSLFCSLAFKIATDVAILASWNCADAIMREAQAYSLFCYLGELGAPD